MLNISVGLSSSGVFSSIVIPLDIGRKAIFQKNIYWRGSFVELEQA
jgi:hypothetical protein